MFSTQLITHKTNALLIHGMLHLTNVVGEAHRVQSTPARYILQSSLLIARVLAPAPIGPNCGNGNDPSQDIVGTLRDGIKNIVQILIGVGVGISVVGIIIGGLMRATSFGNERRIAMSNTAITCAVVGLVIVMLGATVGNAIPGWFGIANYDNCKIK